KSSSWYAASLAPMCTDISLEDKETYATVTFVYALSIHRDVKVTVTYTVYADGSIKVHSAYEGVKGLPDVPIHALSFKIPADYNQIDWYANGPEANYVDRANGARLCRFSNNTEDNIDAYSVPQESG